MLLFQPQQLFLVLRCITTENILGPLIFSEHDTKPLKSIPSLKKQFKCHFDIENVRQKTIGIFILKNEVSLKSEACEKMILKSKEYQIIFYCSLFVGSKNQIK